MGVFSNLGMVIKDSALSGITKGLRNVQLSLNMPSYNGGQGNDVYSNSFIEPIDIDNDFSLFDTAIDSNEPFGEEYGIALKNKTGNKFSGQFTDKLGNKIDVTTRQGNNDIGDDGIYYYADDAELDSDKYRLNLPSWGYKDFINERNIFIKHLSNGFDEPGWFYFKLFFDFDSNHGLFGSILKNSDKKSTSDDEIEKFISTNSAYQYLNICKRFHKYENLGQRAISLKKFTRLLSFININSPWFFNGINNLSSLSNPQIDKFGEDKYIELILSQEAVDMRITTLLSLYKYACYDDINNKEIIPENLRKFDMCLLIFSSPIKYVHDISNSKKFYKSTTESDNLMSYKLYRFYNCEIDPNTLGTYIPSDLKNETAFELGTNTLKIKYDKVYEYNMNEYMGILIGSDGIYIDNPNIEIKDVMNLTTYSEEMIHQTFNKLFKSKTNFLLGNIFGQDRRVYEPNMNSFNTINKFTEYAKTKYGLMSGKSNRKNWTLNTGFDILYKLLGTGYNANAEVLKVGGQVIGDGTVLNGHGEYRVGSAVWRSKINRMVNGSNKLSDREIRLTTVGKGKATNWAQNLHDMALNSVKPLKFI